MPGQNKFYYFSSTGFFYGIPTLTETLSSLNEGGFVWLNYYNPDKEEINALVDLIGIHPLSVEDCFDEQQVPKMENFQNNTFILFNSFTYQDGDLFVDEINLFTGKNYLVTISGHNSGGRRPLKGFEDIVENDVSAGRYGPAWLLHKVIDYIVDQKYSAFDTMEDELNNAEDDLLNNLNDFKPMRLLHLRRDISSLRKSLYHEREILVKINRLDSPFIPEKAMVPFRDIYDHLAKLFELSDTYHETETSLMELYTSMLNNRMTQMSNETNASVKRLTIITTVFMPLTLVASIGGMSEWTMMTGTENWKISYPLFFLGLAVLGVLNYWVINRFYR
jgi:magnesium transporter